MPSNNSESPRSVRSDSGDSRRPRGPTVPIILGIENSSEDGAPLPADHIAARYDGAGESTVNARGTIELNGNDDEEAPMPPEQRISQIADDVNHKKPDIIEDEAPLPEDYAAGTIHELEDAHKAASPARPQTEPPTRQGQDVPNHLPSDNDDRQITNSEIRQTVIRPPSPPTSSNVDQSSPPAPIFHEVEATAVTNEIYDAIPMGNDDQIEVESSAPPPTTWWQKYQKYILGATIVVVAGLAVAASLGFNNNDTSDGETEQLVSTSSVRPTSSPSSSTSPSILPPANTTTMDGTVALRWEQRGQSISGEVDSLAFSGNGMILAIGDGTNYHWSDPISSGQVNIYSWDEASLSYKQLGSLYGDSEVDGFADLAESVSLSEDGKTLAIGSYYSADENSEEGGPGHVTVYEWDQSTFNYEQLQSIYGEKVGFGSSVTLSSDGKTLSVGSYGPLDEEPGFVKVYGWNEATLNYTQLGEALVGDEAFEQFGASLSISEDGKILAVGAPFNEANGLYSGRVKIFGWDEAALNYKQLGDNLSGGEYDYFGTALSLSADGETLAVGAHQAGGLLGANHTGYVRIYKWDETSSKYEQPVATFNGAEGGDVGNWWEEALLNRNEIGDALYGDAHNDLFGAAVSLSADGKFLAVGAPRNGGNGDLSGQVNLYGWDEAMLTYKKLGQPLYGEADGDKFGSFVFLSSDGKKLAVAGGNEGGDDISGKVNTYNLDDT